MDPITDTIVDFSNLDSNAFAILGRVTQSMKRQGHSDKVADFRKEATSGDYNHLLQTCYKYCTVTMDDKEDEEECSECDGWEDCWNCT